MENKLNHDDDDDDDNDDSYTPSASTGHREEPTLSRYLPTLTPGLFKALTFRTSK